MIHGVEKFSAFIKKEGFLLFAAAALFGLLFLMPAPLLKKGDGGGAARPPTSVFEEEVLPQKGIPLPVRWGNLGSQMVRAGVIDGKKFEALYQSRGGLDREASRLLYGEENGALRITSQNAGMFLNLLWAFGLSNKNPILERGPMATAGEGKTGNYASTGGWTLGAGGAMAHYSTHEFVRLTAEAQTKVERMSKQIYRPCCNNSAYFPDCNHGMAMLGLLELMASQGVAEKDMYRAALAVNGYWFPDAYLTIVKYLKTKGLDWSDADPKELLGFRYSSMSGYREILKTVTPESSRGGGCGI